MYIQAAPGGEILFPRLRNSRDLSLPARISSMAPSTSFLTSAGILLASSGLPDQCADATRHAYGVGLARDELILHRLLHHVADQQGNVGQRTR